MTCYNNSNDYDDNPYFVFFNISSSIMDLVNAVWTRYKDGWGCMSKKFLKQWNIDRREHRWVEWLLQEEDKFELKTMYFRLFTDNSKFNSVQLI